MELTEEALIILAENHPDDDTANLAMSELRNRFDPSYGWCLDCDGLVCKEKDYCLNITTPTPNNFTELF